MSKRINSLAIHDLSGFGGCSLSVVLPILTAMGVQVCSLPTAILSTHTGGFDDYHLLDLTNEMPKMLKHWTSLNLKFDAIYSGFLGSAKQVKYVITAIEKLSTENSIILIDPVLGDNNECYSTVTKKLINNMRNLISYANIITPNITEAALLLNKKIPKHFEKTELMDWCLELSKLGPNKIVITSAPSNEKILSDTIAYDSEQKKFWKSQCPYLPVSYPGTGDIFASVLLGSLLQKNNFVKSLGRSVYFVYNAINETIKIKTPVRESVILEQTINFVNNNKIAPTLELFYPN